MLPLYPGKWKIWRRSSEILSERVAQSPIGVKKKIPFVPFFSIIISPIMLPPALTSAIKFSPKQSKGTTFFGLTSKTSWKSESLRWRSRLHLAKFRFYIGRHLSTKCRGSRFTFYLFFFCIISPVGVVGQPVVGRHQQVDRVDLWRLGNHDDDDDDDDFRLWWWWR